MENKQQYDFHLNKIKLSAKLIRIDFLNLLLGHWKYWK